MATSRMSVAEARTAESITHNRGSGRGAVLVVDDDGLNRRLLAEALTSGGYTVLSAADGGEALRLIESAPIDVVLLDVAMPRMNGLDVLRAVRQDHSQIELPVVMTTANGDSEMIVAAFEAGANDYVTKPFDLAATIARLDTHVTLKRTTEQLEQANRRLDSINRQLEDDLDAAARIQRQRLPEPAPRFDQCRFAWRYHPCERVGGDFLNVFRVDADHVAFYVLDVSGHGVRSALLSCAASWILQPPSLPVTPSGGDAQKSRPARLSPALVADALNSRFASKSSSGQFFTLMYAVLDERTLELRYVSTGHPPMIYLPASGAAHVLEGRGFPIGLLASDHEKFQPYRERVLQLAPGDRLYSYTDGLSDLRNADDELFGTRRLVECIESARDQTLEDSMSDVMKCVEGWSEPSLVRDDISILGLEIAADHTAALMAG